ncbi:sensor histidine kinase [Subtercola lobariae]|uniref:histidine kinase n=1 Tax=Subtercola lobariae TaxID=1588641 RepID=A0A917B7G6_9MICO|nr:HAMP domain-containing sensor histidine kinase [Subtercola lobariae]GGF29384.1 two-component sensor histidine kinase [Subtercola lobariae]
MNLLRRLSIRVRLTIGAVVIAAVFFTGTAFVVRHQVESILENSSVMLLQSDSAPFQQDIAAGKGSTLDSPAQGQLIAIINPDGLVEESTFPIELQPQLGALASAGTDTQSVHTPAADYLVISRTVEADDGTWHVVTARNESASKISVDNLTRALTIGLIILTALFGFGSWLLASAALRPVSAMRRTAHELQGSASTELLPVGPARDELSALATTLNDLITQLRASADREKQLVSDASHELRTPLAILQTQLELAHLSTGDADALLLEIESAERTVKRLSGLAASLLELTRIEGMVGGDETAVGELSAELVDSIDRARIVAIGSGIVVDYDIEVLPADWADGWSAALSRYNFGRVLDNLLGNSIAAITAESVDSEVSGTVGADLAFINDPVHPALRLTVTDTGPGMSEEFLPQAFDRFTREDEARGGAGSVAGGAGLGLSIVSALMLSAGGTVTMTNRRPSGLSVVAEIPVSPIQREAV